MTSIAVIKETKAGEDRVAINADAVKRYVALGAKVTIERGAGAGSSIPDKDYEAMGATLAANAAEALSGADIVLKVSAPSAEELALIPRDSMLIGMLEPFANKDLFAAYNQKNISAFSLEMLPRISRAQAMDVLSSQSNLAGYRAVIEASTAFGKVVPMMMTAAGTVPAAKALILGAGVAGLQAIATAKRLGAIVSAFDVRTAAKEQVESLGAKFIEVKAEESGDAAGGYAKEMSDDYKRKQGELIAETLKKQDMVISTALIPGKPAPVLITEDMLKDMKPGSVIVDLAAASGGNCPLTEADKVVVKHGVTLIGYTNMPSRASTDASNLYARNLYNFLSTLIIPEAKWEDELVVGTLLTRNGATVHKMFS
jgi:NAD(P) transhydrogenase subunit alpha